MPQPLSFDWRGRSTAARAWSVRQAERARHHAGRAVSWTHRKLVVAPWRPIGLWAGGIFGVLVILIVSFLTFADWNMLKGPISRMASNASGREIVIVGDLDVNPWRWQPEVRVTELKIGNPLRFDERGEFANIAQATATVRWLPLLIGRLDIVRLEMQGADVSLYRNAEGDSNWGRAPGEPPGEPFNLPAIRSFSLQDGSLRLVDEKRGMVLEAALTSEESSVGGQFTLNGDGSLNNRPFRLELTGAPLVNVRRDRPYDFVADVRAGATRIQADGTIRRPFDLKAWQADVIVSGSDLADLYYLIGLSLPNTPPYRLAGQVGRDQTRYWMDGITGRIGDSDLAGSFVVTRVRDRPMFEGDFRTRSLDFDDLLAVLGGAPATTAGESVSAEQRVMAAQLAAQGRLLPDASLNISRVRNMDARVSYRATDVRTDKLPLRGLAVDITLDQGLLRLDPITLHLTQGRLTGATSINAREAMPQVDLDMRLTGARLEQIFAMQGEPALTGALAGRVRLSGRGASARDAAANANGAVSFVVPDGEIREAFAELTGVNVVRGLGLLLSEDQGKIGIRCGIAHFRVRDGIMQADNIVVDTDTMLIRGGGQVSLRDETLDLRLRGEPKEVRLIRLAAPVTLTGRLRSPQIGVDAGRAIRQGGIAAALGALVAPLAIVLPFIDAGLAEDADCTALLSGRPAVPASES